MQLKQIAVAFSRTTWTSPRLTPRSRQRQKISIRTRGVGRIFCIMGFLSGKLSSRDPRKTAGFDRGCIENLLLCMELIKNATHGSLPVAVTLKTGIPKAGQVVNRHFLSKNTNPPADRHLSSKNSADKYPALPSGQIGQSSLIQGKTWGRR